MKGNGFCPWHTFEMAPWLQVAVVLAQLCTGRVLAVSLWHDQTWKPVVWRLRATQPWGRREMQWKLQWKGKKLPYFILFCYKKKPLAMFALTKSLVQHVSRCFNMSKPQCLPS